MPQLYDLKRDGVTQSVLAGFQKCRVYTKLSLIEGWTLTRPKPTFQYGDLFHGVAEHIYGDKHRDEPPTEREIVRQIDKQMDKWKTDHPTADADILNQLEFNAAILQAVLVHYFNYWAKQDFQQIKWVSQEEEFEFPIPLQINGKTFNLIIRGKMDGLYREGKPLFLFESKTKSQIDEKVLYELLTFDFQTDLYSLAIFEKYKEYPAGVRYNVVRKPGNKLLKGETLPALIKRISGEVRKDPKHYFKRYKIYRPIADLKLFRGELIHLLTEFVQWNRGELPTYRNTHSCVNKYGTCSMIQICSAKNYKPYHRRKEIFKELSYKREA